MKIALPEMKSWLRPCQVPTKSYSTETILPFENFWT